MGYNFQAARVARTARSLTGSKITKTVTNQEPAWLRAVEAIPPSEIMTRPYPIQHSEPDPRARKPRNLFRPTRIVYPEDELRRDFFKDHPWELARPRMILETDGKDSRHWDWSKGPTEPSTQLHGNKGLRQPGLALSGECVVQRQLWLMENTGMPKQKAYDLVRHDFYKLRQRDQIEDRIAIEEARYVGGYFGKNQIQVGLEVEDREFELWKAWAGREIKRKGDEFDESQALVAGAEEIGAEDLLEPLRGEV